MSETVRATTVQARWVLVGGVAAVALVDVVLLVVGDDVNRAIPAMLLLVVVLLAGLLGGRMVALGVALVAAIGFAVLLPPIGSPRVELAGDLAALVLFVAVAAIAGVLLSTIVLSDRRRLSAEQGRVEALRRVDHDRAALLRSVSHDLRTPLATIRAAATDLQGFDHDPATRTHLLDLVIDESERLDRIVGNLLSLSRIEAGALLPERQPVDLAELVAACSARLQRATSKVTVELHASPDLPLVAVDYSQIDQVVANLLENAARHSPDGSVVVVELERVGGMVRLSVSDQGTGFDPSVRERLFEPFASATGSGSSGIGLAICKAVVDAHGGTITADDVPAGGARITVEIPIDA
jgi:K+-sensing histidine kinase KdpD